MRYFIALNAFRRRFIYGFNCKEVATLALQPCLAAIIHASRSKGGYVIPSKCGSLNRPGLRLEAVWKRSLLIL